MGESDQFNVFWGLLLIFLGGFAALVCDRYISSKRDLEAKLSLERKERSLAEERAKLSLEKKERSLAEDRAKLSLERKERSLAEERANLEEQKKNAVEEKRKFEEERRIKAEKELEEQKEVATVKMADLEEQKRITAEKMTELENLETMAKKVINDLLNVGSQLNWPMQESEYQKKSFTPKTLTKNQKNGSTDKNQSPAKIITNDDSNYPCDVENRKEISGADVKDISPTALNNVETPGVQTDANVNSLAGSFGHKKKTLFPVQIIEKLSREGRFKSIGYIYWNNCRATCWLLAEDIIITCEHVIDMITTERSRTSDQTIDKRIRVDFYYDCSPQRAEGAVEVDEKRVICCDKALDLYICYLKGTPPTDLTPLGDLIRPGFVDSGDSVILVGHPNGDHKAIDIGMVMNSHNWHAKLHERAASAKQYCSEHPNECRMKNTNANCVHHYERALTRETHANEIPFDTGCFHGASGSAVFNKFGAISGLYRRGYPFSKNLEEVSLMEFAVDVKAIYDRIANDEKLGENWAKYLFPKWTSS